MSQQRATLWGAWLMAGIVLLLIGCHRAQHADVGLPAAAAEESDGVPLSTSGVTNAPPPMPAQEQPEVLTRGPVHEAFAAPVPVEVQAGLVTTNPPPPVIAEVPPTQKPEGEDYVWVPGYWSWDTDRRDYIWVSGCWRVPPPNMSWVPGYWCRVSDGWEWVAGFWAPADVSQLDYLPAPPALGDVTPPGEPPTADTIWVPPCWYWQQNRYVRRDGYWLAAHVGWVWVPSHYIWTPRGYVFSPGHWDYELAHRGVLFAPVHFPRPAHGEAGFSYSPDCVVNVETLTDDLFACPHYCHYYYGDYFDDDYARLGIYPWFECERMHTWYCPTYEYDRWEFRRREPEWDDRVRRDFEFRRSHADSRPPRTFHELQTRLAAAPQGRGEVMQPVRMLSAAVGLAAPVRFAPVASDARHAIAEQGSRVHTFREARTRWETTPELRAPVAPAPERHAAPALVPSEHRETSAPSEQREAREVPWLDRRPSAPASLDVRRPETPRAELERRPTPAAPAVNIPLSVLPEHHEPVAVPRPEHRPAYVPPREVHVTHPERISIPPPAIVGRRTTPAAPARAASPPRSDEDRRRE